MHQSNSTPEGISGEKSAGNAIELDAAYVRYFEELRNLARGRMANEWRKDHTLQPTALVNEAYCKLRGKSNTQYASFGHLKACIATTMFEILTDHARRKSTKKRGGKSERVELTGDEKTDEERRPEIDELENLRSSLQRLQSDYGDKQYSTIVLLRKCWQLTEQETADWLEMDLQEVKNDYRFAMAVLRDQLDSK